MTAAPYTPPHANVRPGRADLELTAGRTPSSPAAEPDCAARRAGSPASAATNAAWCAVGALARVVARASRCRSGTPSRSSAARAARAARAATGRAERAQLGAALASRPARPRLQVRRSRPAPQLVGGDVGGAGSRRRASSTRRDVGQLEHAPRRNVDALVPVVAEELGVEGDDRAGRRRSRRSLARRARGPRARRARGRRARRRWPTPACARGGEPVRVAVVAVRRVAARVPDAVDRRRGRAGRARSRPRLRRGPRSPSTSVQSTQVTCTPASSSSSSSHGACAHSGSQKPPSQAPKRRAVRRDPGLQLQADAGVGGQQREHGVGGRATSS